MSKLLKALATIGYVEEKDGRFYITKLTQKWFFDTNIIDLQSLMLTWDAFFTELWPLAPAIVQTGTRPFSFYEYVNKDQKMSHAFQQTMIGNANIIGPDVVKKINLPQKSARLLDIGGGHGRFSIQFCRANPNLRAAIIDSAAALETAQEHVAYADLEDRIELISADIWNMKLEQDYDLILLFNFIHHYDLGTNNELLQKVHKALKPGGQVAILDQLEGSVSGSATNAIVQLVGLMYYIFADGRTFSREEIESLLNDTGFNHVKVHTSGKWAGTSLVTAARGN